MCVLSEKTGPKQELFWLESARRVCDGVKLTSTTDCRPVSDARKLRSVGTFTIQPGFFETRMCVRFHAQIWACILIICLFLMAWNVGVTFQSP
jgi:hypothetical protein